MTKPETDDDRAYDGLMRELGKHPISAIRKLAVLNRVAGVLLSSTVAMEEIAVRELDEKYGR